MILVPSFFPPSEIRPGALLSRTSCPSPLSFRLFSLLSVHKCVFTRPPPVSGPPHRPSPIVCLPESHQPSGSGRPISSSGSPTQRPICRLAPPPQTYTAGGTWLGCGCVWRGEGDGAPRGGLESVVSPAGITGQMAKCMPTPDARLPSRFLRSAIVLSPSTRLVGFAW